MVKDEGENALFKQHRGEHFRDATIFDEFQNYVGHPSTRVWHFESNKSKLVILLAFFQKIPA